MSIADEVERLKKKLREIDGTVVRVALFGQPGAGKSSLINALVGRKVAETGVQTDVTRDAARYEHEGLELWDLPGYDTKRFPRDEYFERFRIRDFDVFLCTFDGKFRSADSAFFKELKAEGKVCLFCRNKSDNLWQDGSTEADLKTEVIADVRQHTGDASATVLFTSCRTQVGIGELTDAIRHNLSAAKNERWLRSGKAYSIEFLNEKRSACETYIYVSAGAAALNALNPIPGVDIAVDLGTLGLLLQRIRVAYGLDDAKLHQLAAIAPAVQPLADKVVQWGTKEGLLLLLKQFAKRETVKRLSKYIPIVGQLVAGAAGFALAVKVGDEFLDSCHEVAAKILESELAARG